MSAQLTVWYNTKCPVCNTGIDRQRNRLVRAAQAGLIEFRDINLEPDALSHSAPDWRMCAGGSTPWMQPGGFMWEPTARLRFGLRPRATAGWDAC
jgi:hypothetical protein